MLRAALLTNKTGSNQKCQWVNELTGSVTSVEWNTIQEKKSKEKNELTGHWRYG